MNTTSTWPHKADIHIAINPAKRKKTVVVLLLIFVFGLLTIPSGSPLQQWITKYAQDIEREQLMPQMSQLAAQGKPDAVIWIAENYPQTNVSQLESLASQGNGHALMLLAKSKSGSDTAAAMSLMKQAAETGYLPAVKWQMRQAM